MKRTGDGLAFDDQIVEELTGWPETRGGAVMPERVIRPASSSILDIGVFVGSKGPIQVSPLMSKPMWPGAMGCPAGKVVPRITYLTCSAMISSLPTPFYAEQTALFSSNARGP